MRARKLCKCGDGAAMVKTRLTRARNPCLLVTLHGTAAYGNRAACPRRSRQGRVCGPECLHARHDIRRKRRYPWAGEVDVQRHTLASGSQPAIDMAQFLEGVQAFLVIVEKLA